MQAPKMRGLMIIFYFPYQRFKRKFSEAVLRLNCARAPRFTISTRIEEQAMKVGILTGGGDCPGLNAVIRAVVRKGYFHYQDEFVGFLEGWRGLIENKFMP